MPRDPYRPYRYALIFGLCLTLFSAFVLLDAFVLPHAISPQASLETSAPTPPPTQTATPEPTVTPLSTPEPTPSPSPSPTPVPVVITDTHYSDGNISIDISVLRAYGSDLYIADIVLSQPGQIRTAFAKGTYGLNITAKTSVMAEENNALFAINGDYYGARKTGYVIRDGVLYRDSVRSDAKRGDLALFEDGSLGVFYETEVSAQQIADMGVTQVFAFGPVLIDNGAIVVKESGNGVKGADVHNPRTAIGMVEPLHYIALTCDGRTDDSPGLTVYQLAQVLLEHGCTVAYNLDGGGSATMWFNGALVNHPTTNGTKFGERHISDIVYIPFP